MADPREACPVSHDCPWRGLRMFDGWDERQVLQREHIAAAHPEELGTHPTKAGYLYRRSLYITFEED